ncbi:MAG: bifunctional diguanylate cyclase/phosphodiesterase [Lachnospiraceae bacterium]|nr:bifunctional diguanylate cyclase/phosphodiesterase [Lachnospiraceae bacterium]
MEESRYQLDLMKAMNQKLNQKERMYKSLLQTSELGFLYYEFGREEVVTLGRFAEFFLFEIKAVKELGRLEEAFAPEYREKLQTALFPERDDQRTATLELETPDHRIWYLMTTTVLSDEHGKPSEKVISFRNISRQKSQNSELLYMAYYDGLTGLYNRNYFVTLLGNFIKNAKDENATVAVMMVDLDDFKKLNDSMGIIVGDEILQQFGSFLHTLEDDQIIACHMSNDIYALAIYAPYGTHSVDSVYGRVRDRLEEPFSLSTGQRFRLTASVGVAEFPEVAGSALDLLNSAEIVTYRCKTMGKNQMAYFEAPILNEFLQSVEMENRLRNAVSQDEFVIYYQPQYYTGNRKIRGFEALVRWKDTGEELIQPSVFIPVAEKNRTILDIGRFVIEESVKQYATWCKVFQMHFRLSINISALQYKSDQFVDLVMGVIREYGVDPADIELEITESILIDDFEMVSRKLSTLRNFGIHISLDDFGTGYSSLSYLKKFPIDTLKIDKSFVDTVLSDPTTRVITESILNMSHSMGFETVAEGVETEQQYQYLHSAGCDVIQGFYMGRPSPAEETEKLLASFSSRDVQ